MIRALSLAILLALTAAVTVVVRAPAAWLGDWMQTHGKARLIDAPIGEMSRKIAQVFDFTL